MKNQIFTLFLSAIIFTSNPLFAMEVEETQGQQSCKRSPESLKKLIARAEELQSPMLTYEDLGRILNEVDRLYCKDGKPNHLKKIFELGENDPFKAYGGWLYTINVKNTPEKYAYYGLDESDAARASMGAELIKDDLT